MGISKGNVKVLVAGFVILGIFFAGFVSRGYIFYWLARNNGLLLKSSGYENLDVLSKLDEQIKGGVFGKQLTGVVKESLDPSTRKRYIVVGIKDYSLNLLDSDGNRVEIDLRRLQSRSLVLSKNLIMDFGVVGKLNRMVGAGIIQEVDLENGKFWAGMVNMRSEDILDVLSLGSEVEMVVSANNDTEVISSFVVIYLPGNILYETFN